MPRYAPNNLPTPMSSPAKGGDLTQAAIQLGQKLQYEYGMECARRYAAAMGSILPEESYRALCKSMGISHQATPPPPPKPQEPAPMPHPPQQNMPFFGNPAMSNPQAMLMQMLMQMFMGGAPGAAGHSNGMPPINPAMLMQMLSNKK